MKILTPVLRVLSFIKSRFKSLKFPAAALRKAHPVVRIPPFSALIPPALRARPLRSYVPLRRVRTKVRSPAPYPDSPAEVSSLTNTNSLFSGGFLLCSVLSAHTGCPDIVRSVCPFSRRSLRRGRPEVLQGRTWSGTP